LKKIIFPWIKQNNPNSQSENTPGAWDIFLKDNGFKNPCSKSVIGDKHVSFENTIKEKLLRMKPENRFEWLFSCGYHVGEKE
jgi:hypothetical protein